MASTDTLVAEQIRKTFHLNTGRDVVALDGVSFRVRPGELLALVGPDGAGKSTLLRIIAGLMQRGDGRLEFQGLDLQAGDAEAQAKIGYMPQKFGLYEDLSVQENLDLYADLKGVGKDEREARYVELLDMSGMAPFRERLAGKLSGGMKQKLGLICTLVSPPDLLLLDEPTVGVDPLSRRELWDIVARLTGGSGMSVILSTSYMDEAARCDNVVLLMGGRSLAQGTPESIRLKTDGMSYLAEPAKRDGRDVESPRSLQTRLYEAPGIMDAVPQGGCVRFVHGPLDEEQQGTVQALLRGAAVRSVPSSLEDSFMLLLKENNEGKSRSGESGNGEKRPQEEAKVRGAAAAAGASPAGQSGAPAAGSLPSPDSGADNEPVIRTEHVFRLFGNFIAVNDVSFTVGRGEVFGLLGPNGAGKTTTFRMLCGLLPASRGKLFVAGVDVRKARAEARRHIGYVAQKFSLYGQLTVRENLEFFAGAYGLRGEYKDERIRAMISDFSLGRRLDMPAEALPGGYRQRLAMAVGLLHEPSILFLDEPTSGADPLARREFWMRISRLAERGVTVIVTTHFMEEAEYCDRILIQDSGRMLALGTPAEIRSQADSWEGPLPCIEDAFISIVARNRAELKEEK